MPPNTALVTKRSKPPASPLTIAAQAPDPMELNSAFAPQVVMALPSPMDLPNEHERLLIDAYNVIKVTYSNYLTYNTHCKKFLLSLFSNSH